MPISEMDNPAPYETTFHRISKNEHFVDRVKDMSSGFQHQVDPATTTTLAAFRTRASDGTVGTRTQHYYQGYLHQHRTRHLGIVNELMVEHARAEKDGDVPKLSITDQQQKIEDLQKALIEEAAFLERMKYYEIEPANCCESVCGEGKICPFMRCHKMISYDFEDIGCVCCGHYHDCSPKQQ